MIVTAQAFQQSHDAFEGTFGSFECASSLKRGFSPEHVFGSEGCLKADVVPGCIFSTNYLLVIVHYSRIERRAVHRATRLLETIMRLAAWQTALSLEHASPAEHIFS